MDFDLTRAARSVRQRHADPVGLRHALLDVLFASGCPVREQAIALAHGDAVCVRTSGPAAPNGERPLAVVAIDLEGPRRSQAAVGRSPWPQAWPALGGAGVAVGWLAALHTLVGGSGQRPWQALYVRGPALGTAELLASLAGELAGAEVVQLAVGDGPPEPLDFVRLELQRPRNIWRLPACDHVYALDGAPGWGQGLAALTGLLAAPGLQWTVHDLSVAGDRVQAVVRSSQPLRAPAGLHLRDLPQGERLLFPVNDALACLPTLAARLPELQAGLGGPGWLSSQPDGLVLEAWSPPVADELALPDRAGVLTARWEVGQLTRRPARAVPVARTAGEVTGTVAAGLTDVTAWHLPRLDDDDELAAALKSLVAKLKV
jgi:hypothetical protein